MARDMVVSVRLKGMARQRKHVVLESTYVRAPTAWHAIARAHDGTAGFRPVNVYPKSQAGSASRLWYVEYTTEGRRP